MGTNWSFPVLVPVATQHPLPCSQPLGHTGSDSTPNSRAAMWPTPKPISTLHTPGYHDQFKDEYVTQFRPRKIRSKSFVVIFVVQLLEENKVFYQHRGIWNDTGPEVQAAIVPTGGVQERCDLGREQNGEVERSTAITGALDILSLWPGCPGLFYKGA